MTWRETPLDRKLRANLPPDPNPRRSHSDDYRSGEMPNDGMLMDLMLDFAPDEAARNRILADDPARLF